MWHGYVLILKPPALSMAEWATVLQHLRPIFDQNPQSPQPAERLAWRFSLDQEAIIIEATFDARDLDAEDLARLCKYVSVALGGKYTPVQVRNQLRDRVFIFSAGGRWGVSRKAAKAFLLSNAPDWEPEGVI